MKGREGVVDVALIRTNSGLLDLVDDGVRERATETFEQAGIRFGHDVLGYHAGIAIRSESNIQLRSVASAPASKQFTMRSVHLPKEYSSFDLIWKLA